MIQSLRSTRSAPWAVLCAFALLLSGLVALATPARADATGSISGTVSGPGGPLEGYEVTLYAEVFEEYDDETYSWWDGVDSKHTDEAGAYAFTGLAPGQYKLQVWGDHVHASAYYPVAISINDAEAIQVVEAQAVSDIDVVLELAGGIAGTVTGPVWLDEVVHIAVYRYSDAAESWRNVGWGWTDEDGTYSVTGLQPGSYRVGFFPDDDEYVSEYYDDASSIEEADDVIVAASATTTGIDSELGRAGQITGMVTGPDGEPLEYVEVNAYVWVDDEDEGSWRSVGWSESDETGAYTLGGLVPDTYRIAFYHPDYLEQFFDGASSLGDAQDVTVGSAEVVPGIDANLVMHSRITGVVTDADGEPLEDIDVRAYKYVTEVWDGEEESWWDNVSTAYTAEDGSYTLGGLGADTYKVRFSDWDDDYAAEWFDDAPTLETADEVVVDASAVVPDINAQLARAPRILGEVTDTTGAPIADVEVVAWLYDEEFDWETGGRVSTEEDGSYALRGLQAGTYTLSFDGDLFLGGGSSLPESPDSSNSVTLTDDDVTVDFEVPKLAAATGVVTGPSGLMPDARVSAYRWDGDDWVFANRSAVTDEDGAYALQRLAPGTYTVRVVRAGHNVGFLGGGSVFPSAPGVGNSITVSEADVTVTTVTLTARTSALGKVAGQNLPFCTANELFPNDDDSTGAVNLPFALKYFGDEYSKVYVNNNGNVTFDGALGQYTPDALDGGTSLPIIAPFFADVDTRDEEESDVVTYGASPDGSQFCVNWADVEPYSGPDREGELNTFQLLLTKREGTPGRALGDFDITYNYDEIQWDTGDASGNTSAVVGYASGSGNEGTFFQLPGSLENGTLLDGGSHALVSGRQSSSTSGRYVFQVRNEGHQASLGSLTGRVELPGGTPADDAYVEVSNSSRSYYTYTDDDGRYAVSGVTAGSYTVRAWPSTSGLMQAGATAIVSAGSTTEVAPIRLVAPTPMPGSVGLSSPSLGTAPSGSVPSINYTEPLQLSYSAAAGGSASYAVTSVTGTTLRSGNMTESSAGKYTATVPALYPHTGDATVTITFTPAGQSPIAVAFNVYIDPSGTVVDPWGFPVSGAKATLLRSETPDGVYSVVPNGSDLMSERNRQNPMTTDALGAFGWDVQAAWYKVRVEKAGYSTYETPALEVPPERLDLVLKLAGGSAPALTSTISGTPKVGQRLIANAPSGLSVAYQATGYQWLRNGAAIAGAIAQGYTLTAADAGAKVSVVVRVKHRNVAFDPLDPSNQVVFSEFAATSAAQMITAAKAKVTLSRPVWSKSRQTYGQKSVATLTTSVSGATAGTVTFWRGSKSLGSASISGGKASLKLSAKLTVGTYKGVVAKFTESNVVSGATSPAAKAFKVVKAKPTVRAKAKSVKAGKRAKVVVTVKARGVARPTGTVTVKYGKKTVKVKLKAKANGKVTVRLPRLSKGRYTVKATFKPDAKSKKMVKKSTSKKVTLRVR